MKTLSKKSKVLACLTAILSLTIIFFACKKDDNTPTDTDKNYNDRNLLMSFCVDDDVNIISQSSLSDCYKWSKVNNGNRNIAPVMVGNVAFDLTSIPTITINSKTNNSITFEIDDREFVYTNIMDDIMRPMNDTISILITTDSGREIRFNARSSNNVEIPNIFDFVNSGDKISIKTIDGEYYWYNHDSLTYVPWVAPIIYGIICIIADIIDHECDKIVEEGVAECTRQGKGSVIGYGHCSVTCIELDNNSLK